MKATDVG